MSRIWGWFRARRWWTKTLIAIPVALVVLVLLYLTARAMQYGAASRIAAAEFAPEEAQLVVRATDAAGNWNRIKSSELGKIVATKALRDAAVRKEVNAILGPAGLPTLDDLEDRRFVERSGGMLTEDKILRFAGRDVMAAFRFGNSTGDTRFCVATRLGFWDYAIAPFAPLVLQKVDVNGTKCFKVNGMTLAIVGAVVVASDSPDLLASALRRAGRLGPSKKAVEATLAFERAAVLLEARRTMGSFPVGAVSLFANVESLSRIDLAIDADGPDIVLDARLWGMTTYGADAPADAAAYVPRVTEAEVDTSGAGALLLNVGGDRLWEWARGQSSRPPARNAPQGVGESMIRQAVELLNSGRFSQRVAPRIRGPMSVLCGTSLGREQRTFASVALVLRSDDPQAAEQGLREVIGGVGRGAVINSELVHGLTVWSLDYRQDLLGYNDYLRPCWTVHEGALIVANNLDFMRAVVTTAMTQNEPMVSQEEYKAAEERLKKIGLNNVLLEGTAANGFLWGKALREGSAGFWPIIANYITDNKENQLKLLSEMEADWRKSGRNPVGEDFTKEFQMILKQRIAEAEQSMKDRAKALDYLRWAAFEVKAEEDGLRLRAAVELKHPSQ